MGIKGTSLEAKRARMKHARRFLCKKYKTKARKLKRKYGAARKVGRKLLRKYRKSKSKGKRQKKTARAATYEELSSLLDDYVF